MSRTPSKWFAVFAIAFVFVIGLVTPSLQTPSYAAQEDSYALFSCGTDRDKVIQIRAVEEEVGRRWRNIQYSFGREGEPPEMVFPRDPSAGAKSLFFSHEYRDRGDYYVSIRFSTGGYTYRVFCHTGKGGAGVTVSNAQGKELSKITCTERPSIYAAYLQRALACDLENPHGKAACRDKPYTPQK